MEPTQRSGELGRRGEHGWAQRPRTDGCPAQWRTSGSDIAFQEDLHRPYYPGLQTCGRAKSHRMASRAHDGATCWHDGETCDRGTLEHTRRQIDWNSPSDFGGAFSTEVTASVEESPRRQMKATVRTS